MTKKLSFEEAVKRLDELVANLEQGDIQLDEMLKLYEEGSQLIKLCLNQLDNAEKQIKVLSGTDESNFTIESLNEEE